LKDKYKIVFFGTSEFALPALQSLASNNAYDLVGVVTQPDSPKGRGQKFSPSPIKELATKLGIKTFSPQSLKPIKLSKNNAFTTNEADCLDLVSQLNNSPIDAFIVVSYGKLITADFLNFPKAGVINIHPSILPRWRGAAPIHHALFTGDEETGVAIMKLDEGLDTGPVYILEKTPIAENEDYGMLHDRLSKIGAELLTKNLSAIISGKLNAQNQIESGITYAEKWDKEDQVINWQEPAETTLRRIRTCSPQLGSKMIFNDLTIKVFQAHLLPSFSGEPGEVVCSDQEKLVISCGDGQSIAIDLLQAPGKKKIPIKEFLKGFKIPVGTQMS
jgi:methionyl-tRNA formyltransferase